MLEMMNQGTFGILLKSSPEAPPENNTEIFEEKVLKRYFRGWQL
jgi:hypothetical protein